MMACVTSGIKQMAFQHNIWGGKNQISGAYLVNTANTKREITGFNKYIPGLKAGWFSCYLFWVFCI